MDQLGVKLSLYEEQCITSMISENQVAVNVAVSASKTSTEDIDDCRNETSKLKGGCRKTSRSKTHFSQEELVKPFELGWRREIVQRSTSLDTAGSGKGPQSDIYYFSPEGKKMRSCRDIDMYLSKTGSSLTVSCFSFIKEQIYKEPYETTRSAGQSKRHLDKIIVQQMAVNPLNPSPLDVSKPENANIPSSSLFNYSTLPSSIVSINASVTKFHEELMNEENISFLSASEKSDSPLLNDTKSGRNTGKHKQQHQTAVKKSKQQKIEKLFTKETEFHPGCGGEKSSVINFTCQACMYYPQVTSGPNSHNCDIFTSLKAKTGDEPVSRKSGDEPISGKPIPDVSDRTSIAPGSIGSTTRNCFTDSTVWHSAFQNVNKFHMAYNSLLKTFSYLSFPELLKAREVCRTWNDIACHSSLWRIMRLKGCFVKNWKMAMKWMKLRDTLVLDLRQMMPAELSKEFSDAAANLPELRCLELPPCSGAIAQSIASRLESLVYFSAEYLCNDGDILNTKNNQSCVFLDMKNFCKMKNLEILRLRAFYGIIPHNLCQLTHLTNIKALSLTGLKLTSGKELIFLTSLHNLRILAVGDCYKWDKECFERLSNLLHLKTLRLECREEEQDPGLGETLLKLKELHSLELIKYTVGKELSQHMEIMLHLTSLSIYSEIIEDVLKSTHHNASIMSTIEKMHFLKEFNWSLTFPAQFHHDSLISSNVGIDSELFGMNLNEIRSHLLQFLPKTVIRILLIPFLVKNHENLLNLD